MMARSDGASLGSGFSTRSSTSKTLPPRPRGRDDAVAADLFLGNAHDREHGTAVTLEDVEELSHAGHARDDDVVTQEDTEGLVADQRSCAQDGVAKPEGLLLPDVRHGGELGDGPDLGQLLCLAAILQVVLELEGRVEVILDGALVPAGDEDDLLEARGHRFLHHVLDGGLVHERQHLLGLRLGGGEEARTQPRRGKHGLAHDTHVRTACGLR